VTTVTTFIPHRYRRVLLPGLLLLVMTLLAPVLARAAQEQDGRAPQERAETHESGTGEAEAEGGWASTVAKGINFAALAGLLAYFLKSPIAGHLRTRSETIRRDLVEAAALRAAAEDQLTSVRARLAELPAEIESLQRRGEEELAAERIRMAEATTRQKQQVLDRTRREIDLQFRIAHRRLLEHTADLAMRLARVRIERDITPADQTRLIDRYASEIRA